MNQNAKRESFPNWFRYAAAIGGVVLVIFALEPFHEQINSTTIAFALFLFISLAATFVGRNPALASSLMVKWLQKVKMFHRISGKQRC